MASFAVPPPAIPSVPIQGSQEQRFPVHRIYCVGRNYADHAREMGGDPDREAPFFFTKPADAVVACPATEPTEISSKKESCTTIPYALATNDLHHEIELVIAIGKGGVNIAKQEALDHIFGFAVGVDLTRRDLQALAKQSARPWDSAKAFDQSAPISNIVSKDEVPSYLTASSQITEETLPPGIWLSVQNGSGEPERRQNGTLSQMTWKVPEIIAILSQQFHLQPGDLIFTGTPSGVGPLEKGCTVRGGVEGLAELEFTIV